MVNFLWESGLDSRPPQPNNTKGDEMPNTNKEFRKLTLVSGWYRGRRFQSFVSLPLNALGRPFIAVSHLMALFRQNGINVLPNTTYSWGC